MALTLSLDVSTRKNIMTLVINQVKHGVRCCCSMVASVDYCVGTYFVDEVNTLELSILFASQVPNEINFLYFCEKIIKDTREKVQKVIREKRVEFFLTCSNAVNAICDVDLQLDRNN